MADAAVEGQAFDAMTKQRTPRRGSAGTPVPAPAPAVKPAAVKSARPTAADLEAAIGRLEASVADLKREREALQAELVEAKAQIAALDAARKAAIDRIDWVIDSLHTVVQEKS